MPRLELVAAPPAHSEPAWTVAFNPRRNILASCSTDKTVRFYSFTLPPAPQHSHAAGETCAHDHYAAAALPSSTSTKPTVHFQQSIATEHKRTVRSISWSPTGQTLATGSFDSTVGLWAEVDPDAEDEGAGEGVYRPEGASAEEGDDVDMDGGADGKTSKEWECVTTLEGHESECKAVAWSSDGALLASCSRDKSVWVWELQPDSDFECIAVMMEHTQDVKHLAWHPHEEILASASYDSHINLQWDDPDGDWCLFQKTHPKLPAASLHISKPAAGSSPSVMSSFAALSSAILPTDEEMEAQEHLQVPPLLEDETVWSLAFSPCGMFMASGGDLGGIRIWARIGPNPDSPWTEVLHTAAHSRSVFSLSWTSVTGGQATSDPALQSLGLLASGAGDGKIIVLELFKAITPPVQDGQRNGDGAAEASAPSTAAEKRARDVPQVKAVPIAAVRDAHGVADVNCVSWLERDNGRGAGVLASCADDGSVRVWRVVADE